jgi:hypothetical protein
LTDGGAWRRVSSGDGGVEEEADLINSGRNRQQEDIFDLRFLIADGVEMGSLTY